MRRNHQGNKDLRTCRLDASETPWWIAAGALLSPPKTPLFPNEHRSGQRTLWILPVPTRATNQIRTCDSDPRPTFTGRTDANLHVDPGHHTNLRRTYLCKVLRTLKCARLCFSSIPPFLCSMIRHHLYAYLSTLDIIEVGEIVTSCSIGVYVNYDFSCNRWLIHWG